jgi:hypothetical protein
MLGEIKMSIDYIIKGVRVKIPEQDYEKIRYAEDLKRSMETARKYDKLRDIRAPQGRFAVCVWDPSNPEKSIPYIIRTETTRRDAVYSSEKYACWYAEQKNKRWKKEFQTAKQEKRTLIGESDYFVVDDKGCRLY